MSDAFSEFKKALHVIPDDAYIMLDENTVIKFGQYKGYVRELLRMRDLWPLEQKDCFESRHKGYWTMADIKPKATEGGE